MFNSIGFRKAFAYICFIVLMLTVVYDYTTVNKNNRITGIEEYSEAGKEIANSFDLQKLFCDFSDKSLECSEQKELFFEDIFQLIHKVIESNETLINQCIEEESNNEIEDLSNIIWYERYNIIAHAMGGIDDKSYTNSLEAFEKSYENGIRVYEADLSLTTDGQVVLRHEWDEDIGQKTDSWNGIGVVDYDTFMSADMYDKYTPLSLENVIELMIEYPDIYIMTDSKDEDYYIVLKEFVNKAEQSGATEILDRVIVQFYEYKQLDKIKNIFDFKNYLFTIYKLANRDFDRIGQFCNDNAVGVIGVPQKYCDEMYISVADKYGLAIYTYTVNDTDKWQYYESIGIDGIYSDYIYE